MQGKNTSFLMGCGSIVEKKKKNHQQSLFGENGLVFASKVNYHKAVSLIYLSRLLPIKLQVPLAFFIDMAKGAELRATMVTHRSYSEQELIKIWKLLKFYLLECHYNLISTSGAPEVSTKISTNQATTPWLEPQMMLLLKLIQNKGNYGLLL